MSYPTLKVKISSEGLDRTINSINENIAKNFDRFFKGVGIQSNLERLSKELDKSFDEMNKGAKDLEQTVSKIDTTKLGKLADFFKGADTLYGVKGTQTVSGEEEGGGLDTFLGAATGQGGGGMMGMLGKISGTLAVVGLAITTVTDILDKILSKLAQSSPLLGAMMKVWDTIIMLFLKPLGDFVGYVLKPILFWILRDLVIPFNKGLMPIMRTLGTFVGGFLLHLLKFLTGQETVFDFVAGMQDLFADLTESAKSTEPFDLGKKLSDLWNEGVTIGDVNIGTALANLFGGLTSGVSFDWSAWWTGIVESLSPSDTFMFNWDTWWSDVAEWFSPDTTTAISGFDWGKWWGGVVTWFTPDDSTKPSSTKDWDWLNDEIGRIQKSLSDDWNRWVSAYNSAVDSMNNTWSTAVRDFNAWASGVSSQITTAWNGFMSQVSGAWGTFVTSVQSGATTIWGNINTAWSTFVGYLTNASSGLQSVWNSIKSAWTTFAGYFTNATSGLQSIWTSISGAWETFKNTFTTGLGTLWNGFANAWNNTVGALLGKIPTIEIPQTTGTGTSTSTANTTTDTESNATYSTSSGDMFGIGTLTTTKTTLTNSSPTTGAISGNWAGTKGGLQPFQEGGLVTRTAPAILHSGEFVLTSRDVGILKGLRQNESRGSITINVNIDRVEKDVDVEAMIRKVEQSLYTKLVRGGKYG